jgi:hypothetical protein
MPTAVTASLARDPLDGAPAETGSRRPSGPLKAALGAGDTERTAITRMEKARHRRDSSSVECVTQILDQTLEALMKIEKESKERESKDNPLFRASYLMSSFESPPLGMPPLCSDGD